MVRQLLLLAFLPPLLGACNMVISETPVFLDADKADLKPRDGVWVSDDPECRFDSALPESQWPECAIWAVVRDSNGELLLHDGKGQGDRAQYLMANGAPPIVQVQWHDDAKEDGKTFHVFFGVEPGPTEADGTFVSATTWEAKCGEKAPSGSDIKSYPGITPECRPSSQDAVRSAALASRASAEMAMRWRWLRPANR